MGIFFRLACSNSELFFFIAEDFTKTVVLLRFEILCPSKTLILFFFNLSIFLFMEISLPWTLKPSSFIIKANPLIPIPPMPIKCISSVFPNLIFIY